MKALLLAVALCAGLALTGCTHHSVDVDVKPIRIEGHFTIEVDIKMQKELDNLFAFEDKTASKDAPAPSGKDANNEGTQK